MYINNRTKVKIICPIHGIFEQKPNDHMNGRGCSKCATPLYNYKNIPEYNLYESQLKLYGVECRKNYKDDNILEIRCIHCGKWYIPTLISVRSKIKCINGIMSGDSNLYCSNECKNSCPIYNQKKWPKGFKLDTSRPVQPELKRLVLERDNNQCQICGSSEDLHCHHITGVEINPVESADIDNCITLCYTCHNKSHSENGCHFSDMRKKRCIEDYNKEKI